MNREVSGQKRKSLTPAESSDLESKFVIFVLNGQERRVKIEPNWQDTVDKLYEIFKVDKAETLISSITINGKKMNLDYLSLAKVRKIEEKVTIQVSPKGRSSGVPTAQQVISSDALRSLSKEEISDFQDKILDILFFTINVDNFENIAEFLKTPLSDRLKPSFFFILNGGPTSPTYEDQNKGFMINLDFLAYFEKGDFLNSVVPCFDSFFASNNLPDPASGKSESSILLLCFRHKKLISHRWISQSQSELQAELDSHFKSEAPVVANTSSNVTVKSEPGFTPSDLEILKENQSVNTFNENTFFLEFFFKAADSMLQTLLDVNKLLLVKVLLRQQGPFFTSVKEQYEKKPDLKALPSVILESLKAFKHSVVHLEGSDFVVIVNELSALGYLSETGGLKIREALSRIDKSLRSETESSEFVTKALNAMFLEFLYRGTSPDKFTNLLETFIDFNLKDDPVNDEHLTVHSQEANPKQAQRERSSKATNAVVSSLGSTPSHASNGSGIRKVNDVADEHFARLAKKKRGRLASEANKKKVSQMKSPISKERSQASECNNGDLSDNPIEKKMLSAQKDDFEGESEFLDGFNSHKRSSDISPSSKPQGSEYSIMSNQILMARRQSSEFPASVNFTNAVAPKSNISVQTGQFTFAKPESPSDVLRGFEAYLNSTGSFFKKAEKEYLLRLFNSQVTNLLACYDLFLADADEDEFKEALQSFLDGMTDLDDSLEGASSKFPPQNCPDNNEYTDIMNSGSYSFKRPTKTPLPDSFYAKSQQLEERSEEELPSNHQVEAEEHAPADKENEGAVDAVQPDNRAGSKDDMKTESQNESFDSSGEKSLSERSSAVFGKPLQIEQVREVSVIEKRAHSVIMKPKSSKGSPPSVYSAARRPFIIRPKMLKTDDLNHSGIPSSYYNLQSSASRHLMYQYSDCQNENTSSILRNRTSLLQEGREGSVSQCLSPYRIKEFIFRHNNYNKINFDKSSRIINLNKIANSAIQIPSSATINMDSSPRNDINETIIAESNSFLRHMYTKFESKISEFLRSVFDSIVIFVQESKESQPAASAEEAQSRRAAQKEFEQRLRELFTKNLDSVIEIFLVAKFEIAYLHQVLPELEELVRAQPESKAIELMNEDPKRLAVIRFAKSLLQYVMNRRLISEKQYLFFLENVSIDDLTLLAALDVLILNSRLHEYVDSLFIFYEMYSSQMLTRSGRCLPQSPDTDHLNMIVQSLSVHMMNIDDRHKLNHLKNTLDVDFMSLIFSQNPEPSTKRLAEKVIELIRKHPDKFRPLSKQPIVLSWRQLLLQAIRQLPDNQKNEMIHMQTFLQVLQSTDNNDISESLHAFYEVYKTSDDKGDLLENLSVLSVWIAKKENKDIIDQILELFVKKGVNESFTRRFIYEAFLLNSPHSEEFKQYAYVFLSDYDCFQELYETISLLMKKDSKL